MTSTTSCTDSWRRRISDYHDGGVSGAERAEVEAHINGCPACQAQLAAYDRLYKSLRALPGFEGMLTLTRPGTRRGMGGSARPMFTWPGSSASGSQGRRNAPGAGGGSIAIALILLLMVAFLLGHNNAVFAPQAAPNATAPAFVATPTMGARTANGLTCANAAARSNQPYMYSMANGAVWYEVGCGTPERIATLNFNDFRLGAVSPDDRAVTIIAPTTQQNGKPSLYVMSSQNGTLQAFDLRAPSDSAISLAVGDAQWVDSATLLVLAQQHVLRVDVTSHTTTALPMSADRIAWRAPYVYYSFVSQGKATLRRYLLSAKADSFVANLAVTQPSCLAPTPCAPVAAPWDISTDGATVYYQLALSNSASAPLSSLVAQSLNATTGPSEVARVPTAAPLVISAAPDNLAVAVAWTDSANGRHLKIATLGNGLTQDETSEGAFVWRPDSLALIDMPTMPQSGIAPRVIFTNGATALTLDDGAADYVWMP